MMKPPGINYFKITTAGQSTQEIAQGARTETGRGAKMKKGTFVFERGTFLQK